MTAETFVRWPWPSPMLDRLGDLRCHVDDPARFGFVVDEPKLNGRGLLHAGAMSTIADVAIGHALVRLAPSGYRAVTTSLQVHFLGPAVEGDWVDVTVTPLRIGARLAAGTARFTAGDKELGFATASFMCATDHRSRTTPRVAIDPTSSRC